MDESGGCGAPSYTRNYLQLKKRRIAALFMDEAIFFFFFWDKIYALRKNSRVEDWLELDLYFTGG
jgi:hypothetical protein